jgi:hypothetical protein
MIELVSSTRRKSSSELLVFAKLLTGSLTHPLFKTAMVQQLIEKLKELVVPFEITLESIGSPASTGNLRDQRLALENHLTILITQVEQQLNQADLTDGERLTQTQAAGLAVRGRGRRTKQKFGLKHGLHPGEIIVTMPGRMQAHEVQITDDLVNFSNKEIVVSTLSVTEINGLKSGIQYAVFHRAYGRHAEKGLEGPLYILVQ